MIHDISANMDIIGQSKKMAKKRDIGPHYFLPYPNEHSSIAFSQQKSEIEPFF